MTADEAIDLYIERFGGFPYFMFMGAEDSIIIDAVKNSLDNDTPIAIKIENEDY